MHRVGAAVARLVVLGSLVGLAGVAAPPAGAAAPGVELRQPYPFPRAKVVFFLAAPTPGTAYDVEVSRTSMLAATPATTWQPLAAGSTAHRFAVTPHQGTVVCLRAREAGDPANEWGGERCAVRGLSHSRLTVRGPHATYTPSTWRKRNAGTVLYPGGRLRLPGVPDGSHLVIDYTPLSTTATVPHWGITGRPEPAETTSIFQEDLTHEASVGGRAEVWADPVLPTFPVRSLTVVPGWMPLERRSSSGWSLADHAIAGDFLDEANSWLTMSRRPVLSWFPSDSTAFTPRLQVARGPMTGARPRWRDRPIDRATHRVRLRISPGEVLCARTRSERSDGAATPWYRACTVLPLDDAKARVVGRRVSATDPLSADGRSTRLPSGSRFVLGQVGRNARVGVVSYPRRGWPTLVDEAVDGRTAAWRTGTATGTRSTLYPRADVWFSQFRRPGTATIRNPASPWPALSERISGVYVFPGWARS